MPDPSVVILCGGRGTRAYPYTEDLPKPLLQVADRPMLRHVMDIFAGQDVTSFVLAAGFRVDRIVEFAGDLPSTWDVRVVDTGEETETGDRIKRCREFVGDWFFATYGDGVGDVDLGSLAAFHRGHGRPATLTVVPLPSPYGTVDFDGDATVQRFREKPRLPDHLINAGFFVFSRAAFDAWDGVDLEREVLPRLAEQELLKAYRHDGFWRSMDTYKDALELAALCKEGTPPWLQSLTAGRS